MKVDGALILKKLFEQYRNEPWVVSWEEIKKIRQSWRSGVWGHSRIKDVDKPKFGLKSGILFDESTTGTLCFLHPDYDLIKLDLAQLSVKKLNQFLKINNSSSIKVNSKRPWSDSGFRHGLPNVEMKLSAFEVNFLKVLLD